MKSSFIRHPSSLALLIVLASGMSSAAAQVVIDPTRPPGGYAVESPDALPDGGMTLQSVLISPSQKAAIISGVVVKLGEKYGDAVLVKVAETEVVLRTGETSQVLKLHPGVEKREIDPAADKAGSSRRKSGAAAAK